MGCFSFLCKECGKGIKSSSFDGEDCRLYWLKDGKVHQEMRGQYDSYGTVFLDGTKKNNGNKDSLRWSNQKEPVVGMEMMKHQGTPDESPGNAKRGDDKWEDAWPKPLNGVRYDELDDCRNNNVIAAVHERCFKQVPTTGSLSDPDQGWGEEFEFFGATSGANDG